MAKKFPPKGYRMQEYPLPHSFSQGFTLAGEDETQNSTIMTLFRQTEACVGAEAVEVNPRHTDFAEDGGSACFTGSIVPKLNLTFRIELTDGAINTDAIRGLLVQWMPIYTAFLDNLTAADEKSATSIETILELQHDTGNKDTYPLYAAKLMSSDVHKFSTVGYAEALGDVGLTTDATHESVAFSNEAFYDTLQYKTNASMLRKSIGQKRQVLITQDKPYLYHSNNFTYPTVKRMNPYTFCGILFHLPVIGTYEQLSDPAASSDIAHIKVTMNVRFDEWNPNFDQTAI